MVAIMYLRPLLYILNSERAIPERLSQSILQSNVLSINCEPWYL